MTWKMLHIKIGDRPKCKTLGMTLFFNILKMTNDENYQNLRHRNTIIKLGIFIWKLGNIGWCVKAIKAFCTRVCKCICVYVYRSCVVSIDCTKIALIAYGFAVVLALFELFMRSEKHAPNLMEKHTFINNCLMSQCSNGSVCVFVFDFVPWNWFYLLFSTEIKTSNTHKNNIWHRILSTA